MNIASDDAYAAGVDNEDVGGLRTGWTQSTSGRSSGRRLRYAWLENEGSERGDSEKKMIDKDHWDSERFGDEGSVLYVA